MKTKEYIIKYKLDSGGVNSFDHNEFIQDLTFDFMTLLEVGNAIKNLKGFENAVRAIRMKFDSINNKTVGCISEKLWGYFYATIVVVMRNNLFPKEMERRQREKEERDRRRREFEEFEREEDKRFWGGFFDIPFLMMFFKNMLIPIQSFEVLGLTDKCDIEDVKKKYRELSVIYHPDKGGNQDKFIEITEAKNKCLAYLSHK